MEEKNISALISLLDDPDEGIYSHVKEKLLSYGENVIPYLEKEWESAFETIIQRRIEGIIHRIQFDNICHKLYEWSALGGKNLLQGALLIAKYQYPDLDEEKVRVQVDNLTQDAWLELNPNLTALEKARILNHIFFEVHGFSGNTKNFHAPQNSYINNVLESKRGNPLSLSLVYSIIAQNLQIPIYGVNLPEHFVLVYMSDENFLDKPDPQILFYINPFSKGSIFSKKEIGAFLKQLKLKPQPVHFQPCSNKTIITRIINNLILAYAKLGYPEKEKELHELLAAIKN